MISWILLLVAGVAVVAIVVALAYRKRLDAAERTLRSVAGATSTHDIDSRLVRTVRQLRLEGLEARNEADRFASVLEGAAIAIALLTPEGSIEYVNPPASVLLEGTGESAVLRTRVESLARRVASTRKEESLEVDLHDPVRRVLLVTAAPIGSDASTAAVAVYVQDLSLQRRVDAMRTDFVANASHELKTPLGALALLAETLADARDGEVRVRLADRLRQEAVRMANTVDDILQLAETESLGAEHTPLSMEAILEDAVSSVSANARDAGVAIESAGTVDAMVAADHDQMVSAVRNLLDNAVTYTAVSGVPGVVRYRSFLDGSSVCVSVIDTGVGIPARYTSRVFERFFRVDRARSRESGGTGLGLSIVRNVAIVHGGTVDVDSKVGVGSTFTICLPTISEGAQ